VTPCTEEVARQVAKTADVEPVGVWDLRKALQIEQKGDVIELLNDDEREIFHEGSGEFI